MNDSDVRYLIDLLLTALREPRQRQWAVGEFQQAVWQRRQVTGERRVDEILRDLAYDLDFYEPEPEARAQDPSYYGDDRLEREIRSSLAKLKNAGFPDAPDDDAALPSTPAR